MLASSLIDGFESPYGMELRSTVDWLLAREQVAPDTKAVLEGVRHWPWIAYNNRRSMLRPDRRSPFIPAAWFFREQRIPSLSGDICLQTYPHPSAAS